MSDELYPSAPRTNTAHVAMWVVSILLLVGGTVLSIVALNIMGTSSAYDVGRLTAGSGGFVLGTSMAGFGLLLFVIAWTIAAARR